jgi:Fe-S cluster assembly protein SufD
MPPSAKPRDAMNAEVKPILTPAEEALAAAIEAARAKFSGAGSIVKLRERAATSFLESGLPHRRIEEWKYTDLRALMREAAPLAPPPDKDAIKEAKRLDPFPGVEARRLVLVNGAFVPELSDLKALEPGLSILPLARALGEGHKLTEKIGAIAPDTYDAALALNTAFLNDGVIIALEPGASIEKPIHILHCHVGKTPVATFARALIVMGAAARATVIESFKGPDGVGYQANSALELYAGDDSALNFVRLQAEGDTALHLSTLLAEIGARAKFSLYPVTTGAALSRLSILLRFAGSGTEGKLAAANLLRGRQHADTTLVVDHASLGCTSRELNKSALDGTSRGIFQGKIIVRRGAQKTDARMATHALLLSETAESDNKPELEIFADDVQCGHGATSGALDQNLLFYCLARGIPRKEAEALLIQSFVGEALEMIPHDGLREALMLRASDWLKERG